MVQIRTWAEHRWAKRELWLSFILSSIALLREGFQLFFWSLPGRYNFCTGLRKVSRSNRRLSKFWNRRLSGNPERGPFIRRNFGVVPACPWSSRRKASFVMFCGLDCKIAPLLGSIFHPVMTKSCPFSLSLLLFCPKAIFCLISLRYTWQWLKTQ